MNSPAVAEEAPLLGPRDSGRARVITLLCFISAVEGLDVSLLPATLHALEQDLGVSPSDLATLALWQALLLVVSGPAWGVLADRGVLSRRSILVLGCVGWGVATAALGLVSSFGAMVLLRALNGALLGCLNPIAQGVVAAVTEPGERGRAFGYLAGMLYLGQVGSALIATPMSHQRVAGLEGWRAAYVGVGALSVLLGAATAVLFVDPRPTASDVHGVAFELKRLGQYFQKPTFTVIVVQGLFGSVPWSAMTFATMYFQLAGLSDWQAAWLTTAGVVALGAGMLAGGYIGDGLEALLPRHGRALTAQLSVGLGVPFVWLLFGTVRTGEDALARYAVPTVCFYFLGSWVLAGSKRPVLSELVAHRDSASIFAWDTAFEGACSALLGAPAVGLLAEKLFDYPLGKPGEVGASAEKAEALGRALTWVCTVPFGFCFLLMSLLHVTLPKDLPGLEQKDSDDEA